MTGTRPVSEVSTLAGYGRHITGVTPEGRRRMPGILWRSVRARYGVLGGVGLLVTAFRRSRREARAHPEALAMARRYSKESARDFPLLAGLYLTISDREDEDTAYDVLRRAVQESAPYQMAELYEVEELARFEDPFAAFVAYTKAQFADDPNYPVSEVIETPDELHLHVSACVNCAIADAFGQPRLAQLGCDHDLVGYPSIEPAVGAVFRRPQTLAKGGQLCEFTFYRAGHEPSGPYENA